MDYVQPCRVRRMRLDERMAGRGAERDRCARQDWLQYLAQRYCDTAAARARRWRSARPGRKNRTADQYAAPASLLGRGANLRGDYGHAFLQRSFYPWR